MLALITAAVALSFSFAPLAAAEAVITGYSSDKPLEKGRIVQLDPKDKSKQRVMAATADNLQLIFGVVVDANDAPVTLTGTGQDVFVATSGRYQVLVSSENGVIKNGDYVSMSHLSGIGAKATEKQAYVIGKAAQGFDGKTNTITSGNGAVIGRISVDIMLAKNPNLKADKNLLPQFLQKTGETIAGKPVAPAKLYVSVAIIIISAFLAGSLLYAGVRTSITAIGRNPLSRGKIVRGLIQVLIISIIIFITGIFGVYLLLKL